jgi:hypothetical protein
MPTPRHIDSHAALRGIAALLVVGYHLQFGAGYRLPIELSIPLFKRSYLLVDLFFILSGTYTGGFEARDPKLPPCPHCAALSASFVLPGIFACGSCHYIRSTSSAP